MSQTTVTMSLDRYKELEAYEKYFNLVKEDPAFTYYRYSNGEYLIHKSCSENVKLLNDLKTAVQNRDLMIAKLPNL